MSYYSYEFNVAAIMLLFFLVLILTLKQIYPNKKNIIFHIMLILACFSTLSETGYIYLRATRKFYSNVVFYTAHLFFLATYTSIFVGFFCYIAQIVEGGIKHLSSKIVFYSSIILIVLLVVLTPFTKFIFYYDSSCRYHNGPFYPIWFAIPILLLLIAIIKLYIYDKHHNHMLLFSVYLMLFVIIVSFIIMYTHPTLFISNFNIAIFLFFLYFTLNNSEVYIDKYLNCYNNKAFIERTQTYQNTNKSFAVFAVQFDEYTYIDQVIGPEILESVTKDLQKFLTRTYGRKNVYALYNVGFAMIIENKQEVIDQSIQNIQEFFQKTFDLGNMKENLTPVICIVKDPSFAKNGQQLIDEINNSFQDMKKNKLGMVTYATGKYLSIVQREQQVIHAMKKAIKNDTFEVYYQPIFDIASQRVRSMEALLRLKDEELGFIPPDEFIVIAEKNGMIIDISAIAFRKVCAFIHDYNIKSLGIDYIEYNLSIVECDNKALAPDLLAIMKEYGVEPSQINFEITETAQAHNINDLTHNMEVLINAGSTFSMDDYGTGYSTTQYLINLPLHIVKIDKSILWPAMKDKKSYNVLSQLVATLKSIEKKIVVEGVETEEMVALLEELKCDYLQGYFYSKPIPADEIIKYLLKMHSA